MLSFTMPSLQGAHLPCRRATPPALMDVVSPAHDCGPFRPDANRSAVIMRAHASPRCAARRAFIPRRRPWNRRLHVHAHTRVYASACLRCVGGSPSCRMFPERFYSPLLLGGGRGLPPSHLPFSGFWTMFVWLLALLSPASCWHAGTDVQREAGGIGSRAPAAWPAPQRCSTDAVEMKELADGCCPSCRIYFLPCWR